MNDPERIAKDGTLLSRGSYGRTALLMAVPFIALGLFFVCAGFFRTDLLKDVHGPVWLIGIVGTAFAFAGLVLLFRGAAGMLQARRIASMRTRYPEQPWRYDHPWDTEGVNDAAASRVLSALAGTVLMVIFLVPFLWWAFLSPDSSLGLQIVVGLFAVVWLLLFGSLIYRTLQYMKYGASHLSFSRFPFVIGECLTVGFASRGFTRADLTLRFVEEKYVAHGSSGRRRVTHECWQHWAAQRTVDTVPREFVRIDWDLPADAALVNQLVPDPAIRYWELLIEAATPGIDFRASYPLPVYKGPVAAQRNGAFGRRIAHTRVARSVPFEMKVVAILILVLAVGWLAAPRLMGSAADEIAALVARAEGNLALRPLPDLSRSALMLAERNGDVWALEKYKLVRYAGADPSAPEPRLTARIYRDQLHAGMGALSAFSVGPTGEVWAGSWYGELLVFREGRWSRVVERKGSPLGRIHRMVVWRGELYVAGQGLWRVDRAAGGVVAVAQGNIVMACAAAPDGLWFGDGARVAVFNGDPTRYLVDHGVAVQDLTRVAANEVLVAGSDGIARYDLQGRRLGRTLEGRNVARVLELLDGRIAAATLRGGLLVETAGHWAALDSSRGLPVNHVTDVLLDSRGRLWMTLYGAGVSTIEMARVDRLLGG